MEVKKRIENEEKIRSARNKGGRKLGEIQVKGKKRKKTNGK